MKKIVTLDKANQPYGFPQLDADGNIPDSIAVNGTAAHALAADVSTLSSFSSTANQANSASYATYAENGTVWIETGNTINYPGDVTVGSLKSSGLLVNVYKPTVGVGNDKATMDAVIANSTFTESYVTPTLDGVSYSSKTGTDQNSYALQIEGYLTVPTSANYWFGLDSDDSSDFLINDNLICSWYGAHGGSGYNGPNGSFGFPYLSASVPYPIKIRLQEYSGGDFVKLYYGFTGNTWSVVPDSWLSYDSVTQADLTITNDVSVLGSINFGDGSSIQSVSSSSGDGSGSATLQLNPDTSLGTDQYVVLDPTFPGHIHIRAGGDIDNSGAQLYLGGENNHVKIDDSGYLEITATNAITTLTGSSAVGLLIDYVNDIYSLGDHSVIGNGTNITVDNRSQIVSISGSLVTSTTAATMIQLTPVDQNDYILPPPPAGTIMSFINNVVDEPPTRLYYYNGDAWVMIV